MSSQQALAAAAANPQLSVFTAAIHAAGLDKTLATRRTFTLIIPANTAFASLSRTTIIRLHTAGALQKIVSYHAVDARIFPGQFARGASFRTVEGSPLKVSRSGSTYKINGATVLCGNIKTASGTLYVINKVLLPPAG